MAKKDSKGTAEAPGGAPAGSPSARAELVLRAAAVLTGVAWGVTLAFGLVAFGWMGVADLGGLDAPDPVALGVGGALAVIVILGLLKQFGGRFPYVKPGQARLVRTVTYVALAALTAFGCGTLYDLAGVEESVMSADGLNWGGEMAGVEVYGQHFALRPMLFPSLAVFLSVMMTAYLLINRLAWSDFLIETEGELKKVSWPKRSEYVGSSAVVVVVVVVVSMFLFLSDWVLSSFMKYTEIGF